MEIKQITFQYDAGSRSGIHCVCGRGIRYVTDVKMRDGDMESIKTAHIGSECILSLHTPRLKELLVKFFGENPEMTERKFDLPF